MLVIQLPCQAPTCIEGSPAKATPPAQGNEEIMQSKAQQENTSPHLDHDTHFLDPDQTKP